MSDYATPFADKLLDDKTFDTIFGGELDDQLMGSVLKENDQFNDDQVDTSSIEDGIGGIGKGDGLGSDLGPGHDTTGGMKPTDDSSDQEILGKVDSYKQAHVIDASKADPTQKGAEDVCDRCIEDESDKLKKVDSFEDAYSNLLKELAEEDNYAAPVDGEDMTAGAPAPVGAPAEEPKYTSADNYESNLVDALEDDEEDTFIDRIRDGEDPITLASEEADVAETRDTSEVGDKGEDNLGDDLGPNHDTTGGMKPTDDSSDEDIIAAVAGEALKKGQLNVGDNAMGKIEDGDTVNPADARVAGDTADAASDSFDEEAELMNAVAGKQPQQNNNNQQQQKPQQNQQQQNNNQQKPTNEASLEDGESTEAEEDEIIADVEEKESKTKFETDKFNFDEDDELMDMVQGGKV